ncbi:hypothetical protein OXX79_006465 [Metschnikowia pulcherrima]
MGSFFGSRGLRIMDLRLSSESPPLGFHVFRRMNTVSRGTNLREYNSQAAQPPQIESQAVVQFRGRGRGARTLRSIRDICHRPEWMRSNNGSVAANSLAAEPRTSMLDSPEFLALNSSQHFAREAVDTSNLNNGEPRSYMSNLTGFTPLHRSPYIDILEHDMGYCNSSETAEDATLRISATTSYESSAVARTPLALKSLSAYLSGIIPDKNLLNIVLVLVYTTSGHKTLAANTLAALNDSMLSFGSSYLEFLAQTAWAFVRKLHSACMSPSISRLQLKGTFCIPSIILKTSYDGLPSFPILVENGKITPDAILFDVKVSNLPTKAVETSVTVKAPSAENYPFEKNSTSPFEQTDQNDFDYLDVNFDATDLAAMYFFAPAQNEIECDLTHVAKAQIPGLTPDTAVVPEQPSEIVDATSEDWEDARALLASFDRAFPDVATLNQPQCTDTIQVDENAYDIATRTGSITSDALLPITSEYLQSLTDTFATNMETVVSLDVAEPLAAKFAAATQHHGLSPTEKLSSRFGLATPSSADDGFSYTLSPPVLRLRCKSPVQEPLVTPQSPALHTEREPLETFQTELDTGKKRALKRSGCMIRPLSVDLTDFFPAVTVPNGDVSPIFYAGSTFDLVSSEVESVSTFTTPLSGSSKRRKMFVSPETHLSNTDSLESGLSGAANSIVVENQSQEKMESTSDDHIEASTGPSPLGPGEPSEFTEQAEPSIHAEPAEETPSADAADSENTEPEADPIGRQGYLGPRPANYIPENPDAPIMYGPEVFEMPEMWAHSSGHFMGKAGVPEPILLKFLTETPQLRMKDVENPNFFLYTSADLAAGTPRHIVEEIRAKEKAERQKLSTQRKPAEMTPSDYLDSLCSSPARATEAKSHENSTCEAENQGPVGEGRSSDLPSADVSQPESGQVKAPMLAKEPPACTESLGIANDLQLEGSHSSETTVQEIVVVAKEKDSPQSDLPGEETSDENTSVLNAISQSNEDVSEDPSLSGASAGNESEVHSEKENSDLEDATQPAEASVDNFENSDSPEQLLSMADLAARKLILEASSPDEALDEWMYPPRHGGSGSDQIRGTLSTAHEEHSELQPSFDPRFEGLVLEYEHQIEESPSPERLLGNDEVVRESKWTPPRAATPIRPTPVFESDLENRFEHFTYLMSFLDSSSETYRKRLNFATSLWIKTKLLIMQIADEPELAGTIQPRLVRFEGDEDRNSLSESESTWTVEVPNTASDYSMHSSNDSVFSSDFEAEIVKINEKIRAYRRDTSIDIVGDFTRLFLHFLDNQVHPCNNKLYNLIHEILVIKKMRAELFSMSKGTVNEIEILHESMTNNDIIDRDYWTKRLETCATKFINMHVEFKNVERQLHSLEDHFETILDDIVDNIVTIKKMRRRVLKCFSRFSRIYNGNVELASKTLVNVFSQKTMWHSQVHPGEMKDLLKNDMCVLGSGSFSCTQIISLIHDALPYISATLQIYAPKMIIQDIEQNDASHDGVDDIDMHSI